MEPARDFEHMVKPMMTWLSRNTDNQDMLAKATTFIQHFPPEKTLKLASTMSFANPFFVPKVSDQTAAELKIDVAAFARYMMRCKLTAQKARQPNIMVACAPKSASTFIQAALVKSLNLPPVCLFAATLDWGSATVHGSSLREQEPDELSMIRNGLNGRGYIAQHHARCSPYMARMLGFYHVRPIVTYRNILDTLVSMDDMVMDWRAQPPSPHQGYFSDGMPTNFQTLERADRLMILAQRWTAWLVQFYVTWRKCARMGLVEPLFVSYENDFLGNKMVLAIRMAEFIGRDHADPADIVEALEDKSDSRSKRLNKGVAGRGRDVPVSVRDYVLKTAGYYREEEDLTPLIGE